VALVTWWRVGLRLMALGMATVAVVLLVSAPHVTFTLAGKPSTDVCLSPWRSWRTGSSVLIFPQPYPGPPATYSSGCSAVDSDRWHLAWVLGPGALLLVLGSCVSRVGVRRYSAHGAHPAKT